MCSLYPTYTVSFNFRSSRKLNILSQRPNPSSNQPITGSVVISRGKQHTNHERRVYVTKFTESYLRSSVTNLAKKFPDIYRAQRFISRHCIPTQVRWPNPKQVDLCFFKTHLTKVLPSTLRSPKWIVTFRSYV
jgi:hypothetical protein